MSNGLKSLRTRRGWTIEQAAVQFGRSRDGYNKIERGDRRLSADMIEIACRIYEVSPDDILGRPSTTAGVRLVGMIGAGNEAHFYAGGDDPNEEVERPPESMSSTVAVRVRGNSMYPVAEDGDVIYYDDVRTPPTDDLIGRICVVCLPDDRVLVKRLYQGKAPNLFNLTSANAPLMQDVELLWAAKVRWIKPR
jgi:phage repressor protein C with HTH and peptisase S24 domain